MKIKKNILWVLAVFLLLNMNILGGSVLAFTLDNVDDSIDSSIKAQYNTKKIEDDLLPDLPKSLPVFEDDVFSPSSVPSQIAPNKPVVQTQKPVVQTQKPSVSAPANANTKTNSYVQNNIKSSFVLKSGKKFKVKLQGAVSDRTPEGSRITFVSLYPETSRYITIPAGTVFRGHVRDSHPPYITGNGGLIVIQADEMVYKGVSYEIDAKISIANDKRIFFNNIKGKRKYLKNTWNSTTFGSNFLKKMWKSSCKNVNKGGINILVAPFTLVGGVVVYGANVISSPVLALFSKGGSVSIPSGSKFVIQLREDAVILK